MGGRKTKRWTVPLLRFFPTKPLRDIWVRGFITADAELSRDSLSAILFGVVGVVCCVVFGATVASVKFE